MKRHNWKRVRARSLQEAMELCVDFARETRNLSVEQIADLMGEASKWTLYKWIEGASIPARKIRPFEHACGCTFVTAFLGASAHKLVIDIPKGKRPGDIDIAELQGRLSEAVSSLIRFHQGSADAEETEAALTGVMADLAFHRENIRHVAQPELAFGEGRDD